MQTGWVLRPEGIGHHADANGALGDWLEIYSTRYGIILMGADY